MSYKQEKLEDYIEILSGFAFKTRDFAERGIPIIKIKNISPPEVTLEDITYVSEDVAEKQKKFLLSYDDVLIAMTGSHINQWASVVGRVARVKYYDKSLLNQRVGKITLKENAQADLTYIYYFLSQDSVKIQLAAKAGGAANQANISPSDIKGLLFPCPDLDKQIKIAGILKAYDDLIENNKRQIILLEEAAQRLYKEWFVDLRFPGYEECKIVDRVPEGWHKAKVTDFLEVKYGKDHKALADGNIPVYGSGGVMRYVKPILYSGESVLIPRKGSLNNILLVSGDFWTIDTMFFSIPKLENVAKYTYLFLKGLDMYSFNIGAAVPSMTVKILEEIDILHPTDTVLEQFERITSPIFEMKTILERQIKEAEQARDRLLPKLMTGELEV